MTTTTTTTASTATTTINATTTAAKIKVTPKKRTNTNKKHAKPNVTDTTTTDIRAASHFHYLACQVHTCDGQETASDTTHCYAQVPSDSSTTCSEELLDIETMPPPPTLLDENIAPIFEEEDLEGQETDEEEGENEDEEDDEDVEDEAEIVLDIEKDDFEFCASSRKSTHSVKSSSSRYDKLLSLATPKLVLPTSQSFNDNSRQQISHGKSKSQSKAKTNSEQSTSKHDKSHSGGSQKNIVKRALMSLSTANSSSINSNNNARPKSTSSLRFGHNKLHFLTGSTKHKQKRNKTNLEQEEQATTSMASSKAANTNTTTATTMTTTTTTATTTTTTKSNLSNIITSLLRTTTL